MFKKATKKAAKLRMAISGPSGAGKTWTALAIASHLGESIAVIDTEKGSASKYSDRFEFDVCDLENHHPTQYIKAIKAADEAGYDVIIIDSLTHAWYAELELAGGNFNNWSKVKPLERALIDAMLSSKAHIIGTMRSKTEYTMQETTSASGKKVTSPQKVGMAPIQASGIEYEFDVAGDLSLEHVMSITKTRCSDLDNTTHLLPGKDLAVTLLNWLSDGVPATPKLDREPVMEQIAALMNSAGWTPTDGRNHLLKTYNKASRQQLADDELIDFRRYLSEQVEQTFDNTKESALQELDQDVSEAVTA